MRDALFRGIAMGGCLWLGCAGAGGPASGPALVDLAGVAPAVDVEMRYAGSDNFVGEPIDGYRRPRCLLTEAAAQSLADAQRVLEALGLGLRVYDCYRPQRAVDHFARWARDLSDQRTRARHYPRVEKSELFDRGYIARRSSHSRGSAVDLTLVRRGPDGAPTELDMGTPFDYFDPASRTDSESVPEDARRNRALLREVMERAGFENLPEEWWHYTLRDEPYPGRYGDAPIR